MTLVEAIPCLLTHLQTRKKSLKRPKYLGHCLPIPGNPLTSLAIHLLSKFSPWISGSPYFAGSSSQTFWWSPSVPFSIASPPPDSDNDDDNFNMTSMSKPPMIIQCILAVNTNWDIINSDDECEDYATQFDGPGPPSPSASLAHFNQNIFIKQELRDAEGAQGMLDLWEPLDSSSKDHWSHCKSCWLHQLITNLVGNAIKFTPSKISSKGHVVLSTRLLTLDNSSVTLKFCVLDTSIDKLNLIFNTFCQADGSTTQVSTSIALCHLSLIRSLL